MKATSLRSCWSPVFATTAGSVHRSKVVQHLFQIGHIDPVPLDLYRGIPSPHVDEAVVRKVKTQIAGHADSAAVVRRIVPEALIRQVRPAPIAWTTRKES